MVVPLDALGGRGLDFRGVKLAVGSPDGGKLCLVLSPPLARVDASSQHLIIGPITSNYISKLAG